MFKTAVVTSILYFLTVPAFPHSMQSKEPPLTSKDRSGTLGLSEIESTHRRDIILDNERHKLVGETIDAKNHAAASLGYLHKISGSGFKIASKTNQQDSSSDLEAIGRYNFRNTPGSEMYTQGYFKKYFDNADDTNSNKKKNDNFSAGIMFRF